VITSLREWLIAIGVFGGAVALTYLLIFAAQGEEVRQPLQHSVYDDRLTELDRQAIEQAYQRHIMLLFENWVKDPAQQPARALTGASTARAAYIDAMTAIDSRK
jgi:hypothetical protein